jgi:hypothetical protein
MTLSSPKSETPDHQHAYKTYVQHAHIHIQRLSIFCFCLCFCFCSTSQASQLLRQITAKVAPQVIFQNILDVSMVHRKNHMEKQPYAAIICTRPWFTGLLLILNNCFIVSILDNWLLFVIDNYGQKLYLKTDQTLYTITYKCMQVYASAYNCI